MKEKLNFKIIDMKKIQLEIKKKMGTDEEPFEGEVPIASVVLGGRIIEKHFKLTDDSGSEDDAFSLKPDEFKKMVDSIRVVEKTLENIHYDGVNSESKSKKFRRSLFIVKDVKKGELFTEENIKSIRPSYGLHTRFYGEILGKKARFDLEKGTPLSVSYTHLTLPTIYSV